MNYPVIVSHRGINLTYSVLLIYRQGSLYSVSSVADSFVMNMHSILAYPCPANSALDWNLSRRVLYLNELVAVIVTPVWFFVLAEWSLSHIPRPYIFASSNDPKLQATRVSQRLPPSLIPSRVLLHSYANPYDPMPI